MTELVSVIIPNRNGEATIGYCLEAILSSRYENLEVIVVDDGSIDQSVEIIKKFPCTLIQLKNQCGASQARNRGVSHCNGNILFFTDADCLLQEETLSIAIESLTGADKDIVLGGTYTKKPVDDSFFGRFQSVFINYFETINSAIPDYIATHAMALYKKTFELNGGFREDFLPILEDVEFCHRIRKKGYQLVLNPAIQVRHVFNFSLLTSLYNGYRKAMYWSIYSLHNRDLFADSGTASRALKINVTTLFFTTLVILLIMVTGEYVLSVIILLLTAINLATNYGILQAFYKAGGSRFLLTASAYYLLLYPLAVGSGGLVGILNYYRYAKSLK
jgi:glycosyltransferase involved in cell wall biosynthesis